MIEEKPNPSQRSVLIFLTESYPFIRGEDFIEAETPFLVEAFDVVTVIPSFPGNRGDQLRKVPDSMNVLIPKNLENFLNKKLRYTFKFCLQHPFTALRSLWQGLRRMPRVTQMVADIKLDLTARMIITSILGELRSNLKNGDLIVIYSYWMFVTARVATLLRSELKIPGAKIISRAHRYDVYIGQGASSYLPQRELLYQEIDAIFPVSEHGRNFLQEMYPSHASKINVQRLGVAAPKEQIKLSRDNFLVYSCSYINDVKRIPLLIQGLAKAQNRGLPVRWAHIGTSADTVTVEQIKQLATELLTPESFEFLGYIPNHEISKKYSAKPGSVFINTSSSEGAPVSIMEALAHGFPIIATDVGGNRELIDPKRGMFDGLIEANPTPDEIADCIEQLFSVSDEDYEGYVQGSLSMWSDKWSREANYRDFADTLVEFAQDQSFKNASN